MGSDERHFNVSVGNDGQSHKTVSTNHSLFEEKGELKRFRTEVLLTSLTARPNRLLLVIPRDNSGKGAGLWMGLWCHNATGHIFVVPEVPAL